MRGEFPDASGNICASTEVPGYPGVIECHPDCCTCKYMTIALVRGFPWYGTPLKEVTRHRGNPRVDAAAMHMVGGEQGDIL